MRDALDLPGEECPAIGAGVKERPLQTAWRQRR